MAGIATRDYDDGFQDLCDFVKNSLANLFNIQSLRRQPWVGTARLLCRMDVGILESNPGDFQFYVDDLSVGTMRLYGYESGSEMRRVMSDFAENLPQWAGW